MLDFLREPTPRMAEAGASIVQNLQEGGSDAPFESDIWRYMIDTALEKG